LATEVTAEGFKTTLSYERQTWILEGLVRRESRYPNVGYTSSLRLRSPTSLVDVQLTSNAAVDAETTSGGIVLTYMTSRDRQVKTLALKAEINRLRKELKLEVNLPINYLNIQCESKKSPPEDLWQFFQNGCEFFNQISHAYYAFLSTLDHEFLFN